MNKLFTKIAAFALGSSMAIGVGVAVAGNSDNVRRADATDNIVSFTTGSNTVAIKVNYNSAGAPSSNNGVRMGTSNNAGSATFTIPSGTTKFGFYAVGWNGKATTASVSASVGTIATSTASLTSNSAATGTISANATVAITETEANAKKEFTISSVTASSTITLTTSGSNKRLIAWNPYYVTADKTLSSISVNTAPTKVSYIEGDYFSPTGLVINRSYSDSTSDTYAYAEHTSEFTFSPSTSTALTTSNTSVTITYGGKSTTQAITVTAPKTPASVSSNGHTTTFDDGDTFVYGGTLTATYTDSTSAGVSPTSFKIGNAGINPTSAGTVITPGSTVLSKDNHNGKTVYILYTENNTTVYTSYVITVNAITSVTFTGGTDKGDVQNSITKSGITISVPTTSDGTFIRDDNFRVYAGKDVTIASTVGNIAKIEFTFTSETYSTLSGTGYVASSANGTWTGNSASVTLSASSQARITTVVVTLASTDPIVELTVDSSTSVTILKGDTDSTVKVHVLNIASKTWTYTYDEGGNTGLSTSSYINVSAGAAVDDVHTLTITTKAVGSTTMHISVSGTACATAIPVTVAAKPASMTIVHSDISAGHLEIQSGHNYKQVSFAGEDTDGNSYAISADDVTGSIQSGDSYVSLSGSRIYGETAGTAVVRYTLKALTSVYAEVTIDVRDDYKTTVNTITVINGAEVSQGDTLVVSDHISEKTANTHFDSTTTIADNELLFSYTNSRASGVVYSSFVFDVTDSTLNPGQTETRTIYVFASFDEDYAGTSFTAIIEVANRPVVGLKVDGVSKSNGDDVDLELQRNSTYNFNEHVTVDPVNATESHNIDYVVEEGGEYVSLSNGIMTVGSKTGSTVACVSATPVALDSFTVYFWISITRESITLTADLPEEWNLVTDESDLEAGDQIIITSADSSVGMLAYESGNNIKTSDVTASGTQLTDIGDAQPLTLSDAGSGKFYLFDGTNYLYAASSSGNQLKGKASQDSSNGAWEFEYSSDHMSIVASGSSNRNVMQYNSGNNPPIFSCYASASQTNLQVYKLSGGEAEVTVTDALFNVVNGAMNLKSESTTLYDLGLCDASGSSINTAAWTALGNQFTSAIKSDNKLAYARADEHGNEIEQFLAVYDYVVEKYGESYDFLGRIASGKITLSARITPLNILNVNSNAASLLVVIAMLGLTVYGGYFFLRKKKEN